MSTQMTLFDMSFEDISKCMSINNIKRIKTASPDNTFREQKHE